MYRRRDYKFIRRSEGVLIRATTRPSAGPILFQILQDSIVAWSLETGNEIRYTLDLCVYLN